MAESINDIAIKLSVDAAGVSRGFRTAAEEARSYKAELDRLVYAVGKNDPVDYNAHVQQFMQVTNERLAREKKAQEEFNAWYRVEAEKEFQAWYAVELKKEQVRNQQLAEERQRAINTANAQRYQAVPEAETLNRAMSNDKLEEAIRARYALLDQDERAIRDNAANRTAAMLRANADAQRLHEQDLQNLREYITQKYAILNREEAIEKMNASNAAEIARLRNMRARQAADAANAQRDADFAAYKADLARQEAAAAANAERMNRIERARQRDAKRAADDDRVRQLNDWRMQQALMQRALVDTQLATSGMAGGFGGTAMAIGQASYAAEDFIQVLSMGGGLNMALMSASNNLSMVVRSLMGTSAAMSAVAGLAVPALLIGTNLLIQYLMSEEEQIDKVGAAYKRLREEMKLTSDLRMIELEHSFNMEDIDALSSYAAAMSRLKQEVRDLARAETEIAALEEEITAQRNQIRDTVAGGTIIADAQRQLDWLINMQGVIDADQNDIAEATKQLKDLTEAYTDLSDTMKNGTPDEIIRAAEELERVINESDQLFPFPGIQTEKLKSILGSDAEDVAKLDALRQLMADIAVEEDKRLKMEEEMLKLQEKRDQLLRQETQLRQDEMRFRLSATEAQREELAIRQQLAEFLGVNATGMDFGDMSADQAGQSKEFLELLWRNLKQQREDLLAEQRNVTPTGGLEQDTFQAQADAFKQMLEAQNKEDPQLASIDRRMQQVNQYLEIITQIPGFQIVQ